MFLNYTFFYKKVVYEKVVLTCSKIEESSVLDFLYLVFMYSDFNVFVFKILWKLYWLSSNSLNFVIY